MRKIIAAMLTAVLLFTMGVSCTGCGNKVDYASPIKAVEAHNNGTNIVGKTVSVTATMDYASIGNNMGGVIYMQTSMSLGANIYVCPNGSTGVGIKEGKTVTFKITNVDDHLKYSIYLEGDVI